MERQRSFSFKSSKFLALSLILSFSLILLSFSSFWVTRDLGYDDGSGHVTESYHLVELEGSSSSPHRSPGLQYAAPDVDSGVSELRDFSRNSSGLNGMRQEISASRVVDSASEGPREVGSESEQASVDETEVGAAENGILSTVLKDRNVDDKRVESHGEENQSGKELLDTGYGTTTTANTSLEGGNSTVSRESEKIEEDTVEIQPSYNGSESSDGDEEVVPAAMEIDEAATTDGGYSNGNVTFSVEAPWATEKLAESSNTKCDVSKGEWVFDESYPLYSNSSCPFVDEGFNCKGNGRLDNDYMKWRWQPQECEILRFNATGMLESIRGKRVVFVGDSINRNQWESMLCMLMVAIKDPKKVYETRGRRITKAKGNYSFRFVDYQRTVEFHVSHYLVHEGTARIGQRRRPTLRIDSIDRGSSRWRVANVLIFNTANWWSHSKTRAGTNYYQEGKQVHPRLDVLTAFERALTTWANWVDSHIDPRRTRVFFRSSAPAHFRGGEWNTGGHCKEAKKPLNGSTVSPSKKDLIVARVITKMKTPVTVLNVTSLSAYRIDGHPSVFGSKLRRGVEDCSHWCLPGVPDTWNQLLYHHLVSEKTNSFDSL